MLTPASQAIKRRFIDPANLLQRGLARRALRPAVVKPHSYPFIDQALNQSRGAFGQYQIL